MPKPTVTMRATKAKRYNHADLVPGKTFQAKPGDVKMLRHLGWAEDAPPVVPKPVAKPALSVPVKSGTYQTTDLKPAA